MITVVSVKFRGRGKTYYFDPGALEVPDGAQVVVETSKGLELCECVQGNHVVTDERIVPPLRPVVRIATADDLRIAELCRQREKEAFGIAEKKIAAHGLEMKLVDVECNFEGNKMLFFFTSDGRVDFRELVRDLAGVFRARIELRQIGVRDEAKMLGGIGMCGRPFCCSQFLDDFEPVSTKMAKVQSLSLNPAKISGCCGRLMCCLRYEEEAYEELVKTVPKNGAFVETIDGYGNVVQVNLLRQRVKVRLDNTDDAPKTFEADEVAAVPGGRPKPGEPLPHVLKPVERKKEEPEEADDFWVAPPIFAEDTASPRPERRSETHEESGEAKKRRRNRRGGKKPAAAQDGQPKEKPQSAQKPASEKPAAKPQGENRQNGEGKPAGESRGNSGRRRGRGGKKPAGSTTPGGEIRTQPQQRPKPQGSAETAAPAPAGGEPKKRSRPRRRKPKAPGGGTPAPSAE